jgi:hypothetical protein
MHKFLLFFIGFVVSNSLSNQTVAQINLPVQNNPNEDIFRRKQMTADTNRYSLSDVSFMVRPVTLKDKAFVGDEININVLPVQFIQQFNSHRPLTYADGSMYPTRGWQFNYSAGVEANFNGFTVRVQPEYNWAFNADYPTFPTDHFNIIWKYYYQWLNRIDMPEMFKDQPVRKIFAGQSKIQYAYKGIAVGVSTENLWWGPGRFNSLLMSNNAPGFFHYTLHTDRPIKTGIGTIEGQAVLGTLKASGSTPQETMRSYEGEFLYQPKNIVGDRYVMGGVFSWQPKWIKGLFIGGDLMAMRYTNTAKKDLAKMGSLFARYVMPEENAEVYFQYGRSDKFANPINLLADTIPRGYLAGLRKMIALRRTPAKNDYFQLGIEITQLNAPNKSLINQVQSWYTNANVRHGFTNYGQVLGAPIGPGSNSQRLELSYIKGDAKIGIELERFVHNQDFYFNYNINSGSFDYNRQWVDLMASLVWNVPIKKVNLFGQFSFIRSINYQWKPLIPQLDPRDFYFDNGWDEINLHGRVGVQVNLNN